MSNLDLTIISIYFLGMIGIGLYFSNKNKAGLHFSKSQKAIPGWALGLSFYATFLSAITFLGDPGKAFGGNWNPFVFSLSMPLAAYFSAKYFVPFYRKKGEISAYTHLEKQFGPWARSYAMLCFILTQLARMATIFYGISLTINTLTGIDIRLVIFSIGLIIIIYTILGGIEAVIWTEVLQAIIKTLGALLILWLITKDIGFSKILEIGKANEKFSLGSFRFDFYSSSFWVVLLYGFFINLTNFGIDQNYIQRYHSADTDADASKSIWLCVLYYLPISMIFFFIGTALYAYFGLHPEQILSLKQQIASDKNIELSALLPVDYADKVLPFYIKSNIPKGILGLLIAALLSAAMSTMSNGLNSSSTVFLNDIYLRYFNKNASQSRQKSVLKLSTIVLGLLGMLIGIAMIGTKSILDIWWKLSGVLAGGMLGLFLLGFLFENINKMASIIGICIGVIVIGWVSISSVLPNAIQSNFDPKMNVVLGTLCILLVGFFANKLIQSKE